MKHIVVFILLLVNFGVNSQTVLLYENFGNFGYDVECGSVVSSNKTNVVYCSNETPYFSNNQSSRGYLNASGNSNLLFLPNRNGFVEFKKINTFDYVNLSLTLAVLKSTPESNGSEIMIEFYGDKEYKPLKIKLPQGLTTENVYHLVSLNDGIPSSKNLTMRISYSSSKSSIRIDDLKLTGCLVPQAPIVSPQSPNCLFKVVDLPSNTFIQTTPTGTDLNPLNIVLQTGTYYARTISTTFGCSSVWSKPKSIYVRVDSLPTIKTQPKNTITVIDTTRLYYLTVKTDFYYEWQTSKDNGNTWVELAMNEYFYTKSDTLFMNFNRPDYTSFNGNQFRIKLFNNGCNSYSDASTVIIGSGLPINLIDFFVTEFFTVNMIHFETFGEKNTKKFEIQKSTDNVKWDEIGEITAAINSEVYVNYIFYDNILTNDLNYYRLKMFYSNNEFIYSPTISLRRDSENDKKYYDLSGLEVTELKPNTYYIETVKGISKRIVIAK
jgi:hypothetical protein